MYSAFAVFDDLCPFVTGGEELERIIRLAPEVEVRPLKSSTGCEDVVLVARHPFDDVRSRLCLSTPLP